MNEAIMASGRPAERAEAVENRARPSVTRVALTWALVMAAMVVIIPSLFVDPFIRHDDYAALLGRSDIYYGSTLAEGRWLNYWWSLRPVLFDHGVIFAIFLGLWGLSATLLSATMFTEDHGHWRSALAALGLGLAPPMMNTALWPGTLLPGVALVAAYAAVIAYGSISARIWALPLVVIPALMSHGSFSLVMLVMALVAPGWAGLRQIVGFGVLFGAAMAVGTALIFSLNFSVHGHFGVRIDDWRKATPAQDGAAALEVLGRYAERLATDLERMMHLPLIAVAAGLLAVFLMLIVADRRAAGRVLLAMAAILGVQAAQAVATGLMTPLRGQFPIWVALAAIPALGLAATTRPARAGFFTLASAGLIAIGAWHWNLFERLFPPYQIATRVLASHVADIDPSGERAIYVFGDTRELPSGAATQSSKALRYRFEMLTGRKVIICMREPVACGPLQEFSGPPFYPSRKSIRVLPGGDILIRLPDTPPGKVEDPTKWLG